MNRRYTKEQYLDLAERIKKAVPGISPVSYTHLLKGEPLMVDVQASERSRILFMDVNRILTTCSSSCDFHNRLIRSLMYVLAGKNLMLTKKMDIITPKSLRERVMVYLSQESVKQGCRTRCV